MTHEGPTYHPHQEGLEHVENKDEIEKYVLPADEILQRAGFVSNDLFQGIGEAEVTEKPLQTEFGIEHVKELVFLGGLLEAAITLRHSYLKWNAKLPDFLKPGQSSDNYTNMFLPHVLHRIPAMLYEKKGTWSQMEPGYRDGTSILMLQGGEAKTYNLRIRAQDAAFTADFLNPRESVRMLDITGQTSMSPHDEYGLSIVYGSERGGSDHMQLQLPHAEEPGRLWNPATTEWILGMVSGYSRSSATPEQARQISAALVPHIKEAAIRRGGN